MATAGSDTATQTTTVALRATSTGATTGPATSAAPAVIGAKATMTADPTWTVRGLDRTARRAAVVVAVLTVLPYVAALVRARAVGWLPSGDAGMIGLYARDVVHGPRPLLGTSTTAGLIGDGPLFRHPGPIELYALALPMVVLGPTAGMLCWTVFANAASVVVAIWAVFRRRGPAVGLWAAVVIGAVAWSFGPPALVDAVNSDAGAVPLVALAILSWAVACGDEALLPLFAVWFAYYSQLHLGNVPFAGVLAGFGLAVLAVRKCSDGRARRCVRPRDGGAGPADGAKARFRERWWWWPGWGLVVSVVLWSPVLIEAMGSGPSNLRLSWDYARKGRGGLTVGGSSGFEQAVHALDPRALVLRNDVGSGDLVSGVSALDVALAGLVVVGLIAIAVRWRRRCSDISLMAVMTLLVTAVGVAVGSRIRWIDIPRIGFFRWAWVVSAMALLTVGAAAIDAMRSVRWHRWPSAVGSWRAFGVAVVAVVALGASLVAGPDQGREDVVFAMEARVRDAVLPAVEGKGTVHVVPHGGLSSLSLAMPLALDLESHGHHVTVPESEVISYGDHRAGDRRKADIVVLIESHLGPKPPGPGQLLVRASTDQVWLNAHNVLVEQARSAPVEVSSKGDALARTAGLQPEVLRIWIDGLSRDPERRLADTTTLRLLAEGYLKSPRLDRRALATVLERQPPVHWGQSFVNVTLLTPDTYEEIYGRIS